MAEHAPTTFGRFVEHGRVVLLPKGPSAGKLAAIVEIIDHRRVLIDSPDVPRQAIALKNVVLTPIVIPKLPRAAGSTPVSKAWEKAGVKAKWDESAWAKKMVSTERRKALNDFERFQVMILRKERRSAISKHFTKSKPKAKK